MWVDQSFYLNCVSFVIIIGLVVYIIKIPTSVVSL